MNACNLTAAVTALANTIACRLKPEEISLLSSVLVQLGDTLATIAAQKRSVKPKKRNDNTGKVMILLYIWLAINKCQTRQFSDGKLAVLKSRIVVSRQQSYCFWVSVLQRWNPASYFFLRLK